jgi:hypothetical protein
MMRTLGFAAVTVPLVTALHLVREMSGGEALDGVVSGLSFTLLFAAGAWVRRVLPASAGSERRAIEVSTGVIAGLACWSLLWLLWSAPFMTPLRDLRWPAFAINCAVAAGAGLLRLPARRTAAVA